MYYVLPVLRNHSTTMISDNDKRIQSPSTKYYILNTQLTSINHNPYFV